MDDVAEGDPEEERGGKRELEKGIKMVKTDLPANFC